MQNLSIMKKKHHDETVKRHKWILLNTIDESNETDHFDEIIPIKIIEIY